MIAYFILFFSIVIVGTTKFKYFGIPLILFLFSALRFDVGYDFLSYYETIYYFQEGDLTYLKFGLLNGLLVDISNELEFYQLYFIVTSWIIIYFIHFTIKKYSLNYLLSILIFMAIPFFFLSSLCYIRQFTALAIVFFSTRYIFERSFIKFFIIILIATLFHYSAIITLILYFFYNIRFKNITIVIMIFSSFFMFPVFSVLVDIIFPIYVHYLDMDRATSHGKIFQILIMIIFVFFMIFSDFLKEDKKSLFYLNTFIFGVIIYNAFQPIGFIATRLSYYFLIYIILLFPYLQIKYIEKQFSYLMIFLSFTILTISLVNSSKVGSRSPNLPYRIYFDKTINDIKPKNWEKKDNDLLKLFL